MTTVPPVSTDTVRKHAFRDLCQASAVRSMCLFLPAWNLNFPHAWAFLAVMLTGEVTTRLYLLRRDPEVAERRRNVGAAGESRKYQQRAQASIQALFLGMLALSALDWRNEWSQVPLVASAVGLVMVAGGLFVVFLAVRANSFASVSVTLHTDHRVISTGPYGMVRHPMYSGLILTMFGTPLALGSWWALLTVAAMVVILTGRMADEERFLAESLTGYREYTQRVCHRIVPLLW